MSQLIVAIVKFITTHTTGPLLTEFSRIKGLPEITTDTMENRNCKEGDTRGYFKQNNKTDSIWAQERPIKYEHTGNN